jgi:DNA-binding NarL/FixJ family response regulator
MIKLIVVEDNPIVLDGIVQLIKLQKDMTVIGEAANGYQALQLLEDGLSPDIVLTDLNMPGLSGIDLARQIRILASNMIKVIILTMHAKKSFVAEAFKAGASGYLLKDGDFEELYDAIRQVHLDQLYVSAAIMQK